MKALFFMLIALSFISKSPAQEAIHFTIMIEDQAVGELEATKKRLGSKTIFQSHTSIDTKLLFRIRMDYETQVVFEDGRLERAEIWKSRKGKSNEHLLTVLESGEYHYYENGKTKSRIHSPIYHCAIMLLFDEPCGIAQAYAEEAGGFTKILSLGNNRYKKCNASGKSNIYTYDKGLLSNVELHSSLIKFSLVRNKHRDKNGILTLKNH